MKDRIFNAFGLPESFCRDVVESADEQVRLLRGLEPLSADEQDALRSYDEAFLVRFTYNSAAIEGSTLSLADTELVLEGEFLPSDAGNKRLADVFAARGIADACDFADQALTEARPLSEALIRDIHEKTALGLPFGS